MEEEETVARQVPCAARMAASCRESGSSVTAVDEVDDDVDEDPRDTKASLFRRSRITAIVCSELGHEEGGVVVDRAWLE